MEFRTINSRFSPVNAYGGNESATYGNSLASSDSDAGLV